MPLKIMNYHLPCLLFFTFSKAMAINTSNVLADRSLLSMLNSFAGITLEVRMKEKFF